MPKPIEIQSKQTVAHIDTVATIKGLIVAPPSSPRFTFTDIKGNVVKLELPEKPKN